MSAVIPARTIRRSTAPIISAAPAHVCVRGTGLPGVAAALEAARPNRGVVLVDVHDELLLAHGDAGMVTAGGVSAAGSCPVPCDR